MDGTQWVLRMGRDGRLKSVYFNNNFPEPIRAFAETLDWILSENGGNQVSWRSVAYFRRRGHERELWDSIK